MIVYGRILITARLSGRKCIISLCKSKTFTISSAAIHIGPIFAFLVFGILTKMYDGAIKSIKKMIDKQQYLML